MALWLAQWTTDTNLNQVYLYVLKQDTLTLLQGRKGVTLCQTKGTHQIVISTSMPCFTWKKKGVGGGGKDTPESFLPPSCSYTLTMPLSEKSEKILRKGGTGEGGRLWWIIVTSKPDRKYLYLLSAMENGKGTEVMWVHRIGLYLAFFFLPLPLPLPPPIVKGG